MIYKTFTYWAQVIILIFAAIDFIAQGWHFAGHDFWGCVYSFCTPAAFLYIIFDLRRPRERP